MKRVVVTGMSLASPLGCDVNEAFERLKTYKNCICYTPELEQYQRLNTKLSAPVNGFVTPAHFNRKVTRTMGRVAVMSTAVSEQALADAELLEDEIVSNGQTGVYFKL